MLQRHQIFVKYVIFFFTCD